MFMKNLKTLFLLFVIALFTQGCIETSDPEVPSKIHYFFNVDKVGIEVEADGKVLSVDQIKMITRKFELSIVDGGQLQSQRDALAMYYGTDNEGDDALVLSADIGYEIESFNGIELFLGPPADGANLNDQEFFSDDGNKSVIIKGKYEENDFSYVTDLKFDQKLDFPELTLDDNSRHLVIRLSSDIEEIFFDYSNNTVLDPTKSNNSSKIDSLIKKSIEVDVFSTNEVLF